METVHRLPYNWERIDDGGLIEIVEHAPVEQMRRAGCCGEVRLCRLVSRGVASLGNHRGVMMMAYLTLCLLSSRLYRRCCLPVHGEKQREGEDKGAGGKRERRGANHLRRRCDLP